MPHRFAPWLKKVRLQTSAPGKRAALAAALLLPIIAIGAGLMAQEPRQPASSAELATRLNDRHVLFRAMIEKQPDVTRQDIEAGRLVAVGGTEQAGASVACMSCHGSNGEGDRGAAFPRLAGLPAWYMYMQLQQYASGARPNDVMTPIAKLLTDAEMRSVSKYYAVVEAPYPPLDEVNNVPMLQWGGQLAAVGSVEKAIPACTNCHGAQGFGLPPSVPYIAGQHQEYMELQLRLWKEGTRKSDPVGVMAAIAAKMSDEDIKAVSAYYSRVRPYEDRTAGSQAAQRSAAARQEQQPQAGAGGR